MRELLDIVGGPETGAVRDLLDIVGGPHGGPAVRPGPARGIHCGTSFLVLWPHVRWCESICYDLGVNIFSQSARDRRREQTSLRSEPAISNQRVSSDPRCVEPLLLFGPPEATPQPPAADHMNF